MVKIYIKIKSQTAQRLFIIALFGWFVTWGRGFSPLRLFSLS